MDGQILAKFAVPAVVTLVAFLSYSSQYLFSHTEPGPLSSTQTVIFNTLVGCIWITYARACTTDPGRVPSDWKANEAEDNDPPPAAVSRQRYCRKCEAVKPPRSHHCRVCRRCAGHHHL